MNHRIAVHALGLAITLPVIGCAQEPPTGAAAEAALNANALNANALNANALNANALSPGGLGVAPLDPLALDPGARRALQDPGSAGDLSRELLRYSVSCALGAGQSFDFTWTAADGTVNAESYPGLLGLAPGWATAPLDPAGQQWVSACLASRVNAEGVSVQLSSRGTSPQLATTADERATFRVREAAFFGNLFTSDPVVYACYDVLTMTAAQLKHRVCAQPQLLDLTLGSLSLGYDCGPIEVLGPCAQILGLLTLGPCASHDPTDRYWYNCSPSYGAPVVSSITTFLTGVLPL